MRNLFVPHRNIDLILSILVIYLANASVLAQVTSVAIVSTGASNNGHDSYQAPPDSSSMNNDSSIYNGSSLATSGPVVTNYAIGALQALADKANRLLTDQNRVNATLDVESQTPITTTPSPVTATTPGLDIQSAQISQQQHSSESVSQQTHCTLGDDSYQIGERWNPNLPPFGIQVCVLCECTVRQRKSCYEAKVTCRRITNECPVIDSCPDGKKPVTVPGQCCKSCQSAASVPTTTHSLHDGNLQQQPPNGNQSLAYDSQPLTARPLDRDQRQQTDTGGQPITSFKIVYMNERIKEYMSLVKNLPACPMRDSDSKPSVSPSTTPQPVVAPKAPKGGRNDLNGIDTRMAFKSLHDSATNYYHSQPKARPIPGESQHGPPGTRRFDHSAADDQQHPNDVQSASSNNNNPRPSYNDGRSYRPQAQQPSGTAASSCTLGNDTFQVGDMWNPILPPFGVQVCVVCNCIFRIRKGCYETKVTCRRINRDCPVIDSCPDGSRPISVDGQCCKTCSSSLGEEQEATDITLNTTTQSTNNLLPLDGIERNEKVYREFQALSRNLNICIKLRESVDIYNTNRYARRSRQT